MKKILNLISTYFVFAFFSFLFLLSACQSSENTSTVPPSEYKYGICVDSLVVVSGKIESGQTIGELLYLHHGGCHRHLCHWPARELCGR